jgi:hypothetical protein
MTTVHADGRDAVRVRRGAEGAGGRVRLDICGPCRLPQGVMEEVRLARRPSRKGKAGSVCAITAYGISMVQRGFHGCLSWKLGVRAVSVRPLTRKLWWRLCRFTRSGDRNVFERFWTTNSIPTVTDNLPKDDVFVVLDLSDKIAYDLDYH